MPKMITRVHFLEPVENESHICHQDLFRELTNGYALSSSIGFSGPVRREFEFMSVRDHRNQRVRRMICGDHDETTTRQTLIQNCVDGRHDTRAVLETNNWDRPALSDRCQQSGVRVHEALATSLEFAVFGQRSGSVLV